jgi:hypothetical protein
MVSTSNGEPLAVGRLVRTVLALFLLLVSAALLIVKFVVLPLRTNTAPSIEITEAVFHIIVIVVAVVVYDHAAGKALLSSLSQLKLPFTK